MSVVEVSEPGTPQCFFLASNFAIASALLEASRSGHARLPSAARSVRRCAFMVEIASFETDPPSVPAGTELTDGAVAPSIDLPLVGCAATTSVICSGRSSSLIAAIAEALPLAPEAPRGPRSDPGACQPWHTLHEVFVHSLAPMPVASSWKHMPVLSSPRNHCLRAS